MTYQHKDTRCHKGTKEILENIMKFKSADYEFAAADTAEEISEKSNQANTENVLSSQDSSTLDVEHYTPMVEVNFDVTECAHSHEKKKKRRNYLEAKLGYDI